MNKDFNNYVRLHKELYLPYVAEKFGVPLSTVVEWICSLWYSFEHPVMVDNLLVTNYPKQDWHFEVCDTPYRRGNNVPIQTIQEYWKQNQKENQHFSVFAHDKQWKDNYKATGKVSCRGTNLFVPWVWIELDRKDYRKVPDFQKAIKDALTIQQSLGEQCHVFTSGNNSTHILVNAQLFGTPVLSQNNVGVIKTLIHNLVKNVRFGFGEYDVIHSENIKEHFKKCYPHVEILNDGDKEKIRREQPDKFVWDMQIALSATENIDPNLYNVNSLIRQPWSIHESGGHTKTLIGEKGKFNYGYKPISFPKCKPTLLELYYQAWETTEKKREVSLDNVKDSSYIIQRYSKIYPELLEMQPNNEGWVGKFHSIFYSDENAGVDINLKTGHYKDHGSPIHSYTFDEFLIKSENL